MSLPCLPRGVSILGLVLLALASCSRGKGVPKDSAPEVKAAAPAVPVARDEVGADSALPESPAAGALTSSVTVDASHSTQVAGRYYPGVITFTPEVVANVRAIAAKDASRNDKVFLRVGDSLSSGGRDNPFACFAKGAKATVDLASHRGLKTTVEYFDEVELTGGRSGKTSTSWDRDSLATVVGVGAMWPLRSITEAPWNGGTPLDRELGETKARFAVWLLGTNDTCSTPAPYRNAALYKDYANSVVKTVEQLTARGVVPVLTYIPPVLGCAREAHWETVDMVSIVRAIAVARRLPTIDAFTWLSLLPSSC
jgi:hypothetical protein